MTPEERALEHAHDVGFDLAGLAPLAAPPDAARFERWLDLGRHGEMSWFERQRERIVRPTGILPEGRSLLVLGLAHSRPGIELKGGGRVARYAGGRDYHNVLGKLLRKLARRLADDGLVERTRGVVDAGPLLERSHAAAGGLGVPSKAANLLHPRFGPWFFLAELIVDTELQPTRTALVGAPAADPPGAQADTASGTEDEHRAPVGPDRPLSCGTCTACLDACPTQAIVAPGEVDARLCISYQTIENRGGVPRELRAATSEWAFGCDVCSEVCPWGQAAPDLSERFGLHRGIEGRGLVDWLELGERFSAELNGSPLQRPRRAGLARNAALALATRPSDEGRAALERALGSDPSEVVREAAGWALGHGYGDQPAIREALGAAHARERDPAARAGLERTLLGEP